jgi:hypothetical protein
MSFEEVFRNSYVSVEVNDRFTEATITFRDESQLCFRHRVNERGVNCLGGEETEASAVLPAIKTFRLNAKHLEIYFQDGSRWEALFGLG